MKNTLDGGEGILEAFRNLNIDWIISSPGSEWPSLWEALANQKSTNTPGPLYIDCGHELLAVTIASANTKITGRMQAVILHAGAGPMQGSMAINAAKAMEVPMIIMSGEASGYGETDFDPGSQWYRNLSIVGGPQRLMEPVVKWAQQIPSPETLYETVTRAGELAQREPRGPTYLSVSMETMLHEWKKPDRLRTVPKAPTLRPTREDIQETALRISRAKKPIIIVENAGPNIETFAALSNFAETLGIAVVEGPGAFFGNFSKISSLHLGNNINNYKDDFDLAVLIESRAPWYPPSNFSETAEVISISRSPIKSHMVYQVTNSEHYLEGDVGLTLRLLTDEIGKLKVNQENINKRKKFWALKHENWLSKLNNAEEAALKQNNITIPILIKTLREVMPPNTSYVDETITHSRAIHEHLMWNDPHGFFRAPSGLGQGLGYALGVKLTLPERHVVLTIGDGTFLYNPVLPALTFAKDNDLPLMIIIANNSKYSAMQGTHDDFYPGGVSKQNDDYYGVHIKPHKYEEMADVVSGFGRSVEETGDLKDAIKEAFTCLHKGNSSILNVIIAD